MPDAVNSPISACHRPLASGSPAVHSPHPARAAVVPAPFRLPPAVSRALRYGDARGRRPPAPPRDGPRRWWLQEWLCVTWVARTAAAKAFDHASYTVWGQLCGQSRAPVPLTSERTLWRSLWAGVDKPGTSCGPPGIVWCTRQDDDVDAARPSTPRPRRTGASSTARRQARGVLTSADGSCPQLPQA